MGIWVGLTMPAMLMFAFWLMQPIVIQDQTGFSMIVVAILAGVTDIYIGVLILEKKVLPLLEKRKKKRLVP